MSIEDTYNYLNSMVKLHKRELIYNKITLIINSVVGFLNLGAFIIVITLNSSFKFMSLVHLAIIFFSIYNISKEYSNIKENKQEYRTYKFLAEDFLRYS